MEQGQRLLRKKQKEHSREKVFQQKQQPKARRPVLSAGLRGDWCLSAGWAMQCWDWSAWCCFSC